jgi:hypothetical protein
MRPIGSGREDNFVGRRTGNAGVVVGWQTSNVRAFLLQV